MQFLLVCISEWVSLPWPRQNSVANAPSNRPASQHRRTALSESHSFFVVTRSPVVISNCWTSLNCSPNRVCPQCASVWCIALNVSRCSDICFSWLFHISFTCFCFKFWFFGPIGPHIVRFCLFQWLVSAVSAFCDFLIPQFPFVTWLDKVCVQLHPPVHLWKLSGTLSESMPVYKWGRGLEEFWNIIPCWLLNYLIPFNFFCTSFISGPVV